MSAGLAIMDGFQVIKPLAGYECWSITIIDRYQIIKPLTG